ncbi:conserved hypothetical protein [Oenococcus oeni]|nr:conserved hypothetical protein [Oenococcus oeni]SYW20751.1 conserved hypothetical protein [Oenococcus oeni]
MSSVRARQSEFAVGRFTSANRFLLKDIKLFQLADLAQLVEHRYRKPGVDGSNPSVGKIFVKQRDIKRNEA